MTPASSARNGKECLYCGSVLRMSRRLAGKRFCSDEHEEAYEAAEVRRAMSRIRLAGTGDSDVNLRPPRRSSELPAPEFETVRAEFAMPWLDAARSPGAFRIRPPARRPHQNLDPPPGTARQVSHRVEPLWLRGMLSVPSSRPRFARFSPLFSAAFGLAQPVFTAPRLKTPPLRWSGKKPDGSGTGTDRGPAFTVAARFGWPPAAAGFIRQQVVAPAGAPAPCFSGIPVHPPAAGSRPALSPRTGDRFPSVFPETPKVPVGRFVEMLAKQSGAVPERPGIRSAASGATFPFAPGAVLPGLLCGTPVPGPPPPAGTRRIAPPALTSAASMPEGAFAPPAGPPWLFAGRPADVGAPLRPECALSVPFATRHVPAPEYEPAGVESGLLLESGTVFGRDAVSVSAPASVAEAEILPAASEPLRASAPAPGSGFCLGGSSAYPRFGVGATFSLSRCSLVPSGVGAWEFLPAARTGRPEHAFGFISDVAFTGLPDTPLRAPSPEAANAPETSAARASADRPGVSWVPARTITGVRYLPPSGAFSVVRLEAPAPDQTGDSAFHPSPPWPRVASDWTRTALVALPLNSPDTPALVVSPAGFRAIPSGLVPSGRWPAVVSGARLTSGVCLLQWTAADTRATWPPPETCVQPASIPLRSGSPVPESRFRRGLPSIVPAQGAIARATFVPHSLPPGGRLPRSLAPVSPPRFNLKGPSHACHS